MDQIEDCIDLAPLHNPANLKGIYAARELLGPGVPQVAVFDTSFHSTMPEVAYLYAIPYQLYVRHKVRRYGFHGTSHRYVAYRYRILTGQVVEETNIITVHLGNGCSACAIRRASRSTPRWASRPLEGLVMGTRGGDIDPSILEFLPHKEGMSFAGDRRAAQQAVRPPRPLRAHQRHARAAGGGARAPGPPRAAGDRDLLPAREAVPRRRTWPQMGGADAIVFTGGIGENSPEIRRASARTWTSWASPSTPRRTAALAGRGRHQRQGRPREVYVIPTNEELLIARDTVRCVKNAPRRW